MTNDRPLQSSIDQPVHGTPLAEKQSKSDTRADRQPEYGGLLHSRGAVLSFVFLVAGVVGLPLLWMNPNFSRAERVVWSVIVVFYSITLLVLAGGILWWICRQILGA